MAGWIAVVLALVLATCAPAPRPMDDTKVMRSIGPAAPVATPVPVLADIRPNELSSIMVLQYHVIGDEELRWTRTRENFRKDLAYLHRNGYHLTAFSDLLDNRVRVPAGKTPVVLTFDDSNRSQFQFTAGPGGALKVDPGSGLGIL